MHALKKTLKKIGLTSIEIDFYLLLFKNGPSKIQEIANKMNINKTSLYPYVKSLKEKELLSESGKGTHRLLIAAEPESLYSILAKKENEGEKLKNNILETVKNLKNIKPQNRKNDAIKWFHELEGIKKIYIDTLSSKTDILAWYPAQHVNDMLGSFHDDYINSRVKKGIKARGILLEDSMADFLKKESEKHLREPVFIPLKYAFNNEINIYDNKVAIMSFQDEMLGVIIEDEEFANSMREIHKICWDHAKIMNLEEKYS